MKVLDLPQFFNIITVRFAGIANDIRNSALYVAEWRVTSHRGNHSVPKLCT